MNKLFFFLLCLLVCLLLPQQAQAQLVTSPGSTTGPTGGNTLEDNGDGQPTGITSDYRPNEFIVRYDVYKDKSAQTAIETQLEQDGLFVQEWSPSGKYVLVTGNLKNDICLYNGDGNPDSNNDLPGNGDQIDLNYIVGTGFTYDHSPIDCVGDLTDPNDHTLGASSYNSDYSPTLGCSDSDDLVPTTGSNAVRLAIIDSGLRNSGAKGIRDGVSYRQYIIPEGCAPGDCDPYWGGNTLALSRSFNPHGTYVFDIISGWFRSKNMESQLSVSVYKVLDDNLRGTLFQVLKAIEMASNAKADRPHIISISLGFLPVECRDKGSSTLIGKALLDAQEKGIITITSAGNNSNDLGKFPQYPAAEFGIDNLVTVGAIECGGSAITPWSNYGIKTVDVLAPGASIKVYDDYGCLLSLNGTSFACPLVAAKAAFHVTAQDVYDDKEVICLLRHQTIPMSGAKYGRVSAEAINTDYPYTCSDKSNEKYFISPISTSPINVTPNPFTDLLTISTPLASNKSVILLSLIDGQGRKIIQQEVSTSRTTLDLQRLKPGAYWLNITSAFGTETRAVIKR